jgi:Undecaprenyl-phosphate galactose phosphotransferase WbaP
VPVENLQALKRDQGLLESDMDMFESEFIDSVPQVSSISWLKSHLIESLRKHLAVLILLVFDYIAVLLAIQSAFWTRMFMVSQPLSWKFFFGVKYQYFYLFIPFLFIGLICYEQLYHRRLPFWESSAKLIKVCTFATLLTVGSLFLGGTSQFLSRLYIGFVWLYSSCYLVFVRYFIKRILVAIGPWRQPVVAIGSRETIEVLRQSFAAEPGLGYKIVDIIEYSPNYSLRKEQLGSHMLNDLEEVIITSGVSEVVIALPELKRAELLRLIYRVQPLVKHLGIMPDLQGLPLSNLETDFFFDQKTVMLRVRNNLLGFRNRFFKRVFDLIFGSLFSLIALPLMLLITIFIKIDSPGPTIHAGRRLGKNGKKFKCYKFRTMYINEAEILQEHLTKYPEAAEEWRQYAKLRAYDPRATRVGKWLRKFSLDEIPQIINVLKGDMSLVGPRPYLPSEQERMKYYKKVILETVPGITGLWQVGGRNEITFNGRLSLESWYVRNWSIWLDITLLIRTVGAVLGRKGAY